MDHHLRIKHTLFCNNMVQFFEWLLVCSHLPVIAADTGAAAKVRIRTSSTPPISVTPFPVATPVPFATLVSVTTTRSPPLTFLLLCWWGLFTLAFTRISFILGWWRKIVGWIAVSPLLLLLLIRELRITLGTKAFNHHWTLICWEKCWGRSCAC